MKKNPAQRLQPVIQQASKLEQEAAAKLAQCQQQLTRQQAQLTALLRYQADYQQGWQHLTGQSQNAQALHDYRRFLQQLQSTIGTQQSRVESSQAQLQAAQEHWRQQHSKSEALHKLHSHYQNEATRSAARQEQRLLDEWTQRQKGLATTRARKIDRQDAAQHNFPNLPA